eukprot:998400_1
MTLILTSLVSILLFLSNLGNGCYKNSDYSPMSYSNGEGIFYYYFDPTNMNVNYYYAMAYAMDEFNRRTGVRWFYRPNTASYNTQYKLITVYSEPSNSNTLSSWDYNNRKLRIYDNWGHVHYKTVHEAAHGVGLLHEHQRSDKPSNVYVCRNGDYNKNPFPFSSGGIRNCYFRQRIIEHTTNKCIVPVNGNYGVGNELQLGHCPSDHYIWYEHTTGTIRVDKDNCLAVDAQDYNLPRNGGRITIQPCNLNDNRFKFKIPHQQEMESYNGQGVDLSNSRNVLQVWTKGVTNERFQIDYEDNYWQYDRWSILHYGNEIGGDIHAAYDECSGRNRYDTCGDDDCKEVIGGIQLSPWSDISRINWIYRNEIPSQKIGQANSNFMPGGDYSYLMPKDSGCPIGFEDSAFYFDDEDDNNDNTNSGSFWSKFVGGNSRGGEEIGDRDDITTRSGTLLYFCVSMNSGSSSRTFADIPGQYCFMIQSGQSCPSGFAYSEFESDDENDLNENIAFGKVHVVYTWGSSSILRFCCKDDGMKNRAVHVMTSASSKNPDAFSLFPLISANGCQKVHFYKDTQHWVERDSEDDTNSNDWRGDWYIRPDTSGEDRRHFRMQVCHYEKNDKRITNKVWMSHNDLCLNVHSGYFSNGNGIIMFDCGDYANE